MQISGQDARLHAKKFRILHSEALTSDLRLPISGINARILHSEALTSDLRLPIWGYKGAEVGRALRIAGPSVSQCIERGKVLVGNEPEMYHKLTTSPRMQRSNLG